MAIFDMGLFEIAVVLLVAMLVFGPGKIPEIARNLGRGLRAFRKMTSDLTKDFTRALDAEDKSKSSSSSSKSEGLGVNLDNFLKDTDKKK
jgi:sec-independent protein translocase protein TatA